MGGVATVCCEVFLLIGVVAVFWWIKLDLVSLKGSAMIGGVFWGVCGLGMALHSLFANAQSCVPVFLKV